MDVAPGCHRYGGDSSSSSLVTISLDNTPPTNPTLVQSDPALGAQTANDLVTVQWGGASDAMSGVSGYNGVWTTFVTSSVPNILTWTAETTTTTSPSLDSGVWYFSLTTRDGAGNWSDPATWGPFRISKSMTLPVSLAAGWNLISLPLAPATTAVDRRRSPASPASYDLVYAYRAEDTLDPWKKYNMSAPDFLNDLKVISESMGIWLHTTSPVTLTITGTLPVSPGIPLAVGWNLVGYPSVGDAAGDGGALELRRARTTWSTPTTPRTRSTRGRSTTRPRPTS